MIKFVFTLSLLVLNLSLVAESIVDRFSLKTDFVIRPSFYASDSPFLVNRQNHLYIGKTMNADVQGLHFYDLQTKNKIFLTPPIREYFSKHPELLIAGTKALKSDHLPVYIADLLFYDEKSGKLGFFVEHNHYELPTKKTFFAVWDIPENQIEFIQELSSFPSEGFNGYSMVLPIGYDLNKETAYFTFATDQDLKNKTADDVSIQLFKYKNKNLEAVHTYNSKWFPYNNIAHFESGKILIQSYAEIHETIPPEGRIFDLNTNSFLQISIPVVSYGSVFSRDGKKIYLASGQTGELRVIDVDSGKVVQKTKLGTHGHSMGFWKENELVWVRNSGLHIYDAMTLKQKKTIPTSKYFKGNVNVSGSLFIPYSSVIIRNGFEGPGDAVGFLRLSPD
jgi:WD40 repeat protein